MPFTFDPNIPDREYEVLKEGTYPFETISCIEGETEQKVPKVVLTLSVFDEEGSRWKHTMHITEKNAYHLKSFWYAVGHPELIEQIAQNHDPFVYLGKCGKLKTKVEHSMYNGNPQTRSVVSYFIFEKPDQVKQINKEPEIEINEDEIPF